MASILSSLCTAASLYSKNHPETADELLNEVRNQLIALISAGNKGSEMERFGWDRWVVRLDGDRKEPIFRGFLDLLR